MVTTVPRGRKASCRELGFDLIGDGDQVGAGALFHGQGDRWIPIHARKCAFFLEAVLDVGDVANVDGLTIADFDDEVFDFARIFDLGGEADEILQSSDIDLATGDVQVLSRDGDDQIRQADLVERQTPRVDVDLDFADLGADDLNPIDSGNRFEIVLEILGDVRETDETHFAREAHDQDRDLGHVDVLNHRILDFRRQIRLREIHFLAHFLERGVEIHFRIELDLNARKPLRAGGSNLFDAGDSLELGLDRTGDERLHIRGSDSRVHDGYEDQ